MKSVWAIFATVFTQILAANVSYAGVETNAVAAQQLASALKDSGPARPDGSPIGAGFWTWPREKLDASGFEAACRSNFAVQYTDGHYFGLTFFPPSGRYSVSEAGLCKFDSKTGIEGCDVSFLDGGRKAKFQSKFTREADNSLRMSVTATTTNTEGKPEEEKLDIFPLRCPDAAIWPALQFIPDAPAAAPAPSPVR